MCGIAGVVSYGPPVDRGCAERLGVALAHRGPDGDGVFASPCALLVHRRLAIIDPSPAAAQPMSWGNGRYQLVYNGEVYNYRELRTALESRGERFHTASDTEVLLRLVVTGGPAALARVRGMFALALWDDREATLLLARDRFGMKPLYAARTQAGVVFASEIGALRRAELVERRVSAAGLLAYLSWASIPAPLTWLEGVEQLEPGTWRRIAATGEQRGCFADVATPFSRNGHRAPSERELRDRAADALARSVAAHLVADVPVGVFLSGGIDSGAIVSLARGITSGPLNTYTVVVDAAAYSEAERAAEVARAFDTIHHVLTVDATNVAGDLPGIIQRLDQPTADAINAFYVSRAVAQTGIKAVLSGIGGDELFGGYPSFRRIPIGLRLARAAGPATAFASLAAGAMPGWRAAKLQAFAHEPTLAGAYRANRGFLMPREIDRLVGPRFDSAVRVQAAAQLAAAEARSYDAAGPEQPHASVARLETRRFLASQLLRDTDAMSMAHSLEVRAPFADHELQQALWPALGEYPSLIRSKRLLTDSLARPLPSSVVRHPKQGFTLPFESWLRGPLASVTRSGLQALESQGWIARGGADMVWQQWSTGRVHWSRPWGLGVLGRFLEEVP